MSTEKQEGRKFLDEEMTRRQFMKISGKGLVGLTLSASMLKLFGCTSQQVDQGQVATFARPQGLLVVNAGICVDCQRCETNCTLIQDGYASSYNARIKVTRNLMSNKNGVGMFAQLRNGAHWTVFPDTCRQCETPPCAMACRRGAISANAQGVKIVDSNRCNACGDCIPACPWQMPVINTFTGKMTKCNACNACVEGCPSGALSIVPWTAVAANAQERWRG